MPSREPADTDGPPRAVTLRSVSLGLLAVCFICGLTAYNDFIVGNTFLVGNFLPIGLLLFVTVLVLLINAPLRRLGSKRPLGQAELAVVLGMALVSCALPGSGLMRYMFPSLVGLYDQAGQSPSKATILEKVQPPEWLLPEFESPRESIERRATDPTVSQFMNRVPGTKESIAEKAAAVPYGRWIRPTLGWGLFTACLFGAVLAGSLIVRRQWVENERLAFPLAGVWTSLIEDPPKGRALNATLGSRVFWVGAIAVFVLHSWNAMFLYNAEWFPEVPLRFDLRQEIFNQPPFRHVQWFFQEGQVYFAVVGVAFFLQTKVGLSLWLVYVLYALLRMVIYSGGQEITEGMQSDQIIGATTAFAVAILWVGRRHWAMVGKQMVRGPAPGEPRGRYLPYRATGWIFVACATGCVMFLKAAGMSVAGAVLVTAGALLLFLVMARVVAETGLIFGQLSRADLERLWIYHGQATGGQGSSFDYFFTRHINTVYSSDMRETLSVFSTHAVKIGDEMAYKDQQGPGAWRRAAPFVGMLVLALVVGYFVSTAATLYVHHNYAARLDQTAQSPVDHYGMVNQPRNALDRTAKYDTVGVDTEPHSSAQHLGVGAGLTAALSFLRLRFEWWPIHPVGYLLLYTYALDKMWFSLMLGWIAKALTVRFGGPPLMRAAKPFFVGIIIGEAIAAAVWLLVSLGLNLGGYPYRAVNLLPT